MALTVSRNQAVKIKGSLPWVEALVFLSAPNIQCDLRDTAAYRVCLRDRDASPGQPERLNCTNGFPIQIALTIDNGVEEVKAVSTVRLRFTPSTAPERVESGSTAEVTPPGVSLRCLVVDDEDEVGAVLGDVLEMAGHRVVVLNDGGEAIERIRTEFFDLVFTDLAMPRVSGWQVAQAVKEHAPEVPVVLVSGFGVELSAEERRTHGVDLVLGKPLRMQDVLNVVGAVARRRLGLT